MADADHPRETGDDDEWVKQALANAMLGRSGLSVSPERLRSEAGPSTEPAPAEPGLASTSASEPTIDPPTIDPSTAVDGHLLERPMFDATNDPDVVTVISAENATEPAAVAPTSNDSEENSGLRSTIEWLVVLGSAVIVALLLRAFLFQAFYIPSESMEETLRIDDRVLVNKLSYRLHDVHRGDVVVFRRPDEDRGEFRDLIKRVIGLPGESIEARDNTIYIDGQVLIEPYLVPGEVIGDFGPVPIPEGEFFVMGDNRDNSGDSRLFGPIESDRIIGRAFFLFWPFDRAGSL